MKCVHMPIVDRNFFLLIDYLMKSISQSFLGRVESPVSEPSNLSFPQLDLVSSYAELVLVHSG